MEEKIEKIREHRKAIEGLIFDIMKEDPNLFFKIQEYEPFIGSSDVKENFRCLSINVIKGV